MPNSKTCERCKGKGYYEALVNQHDDKKKLLNAKSVMVKELFIK